MRSSDMNKNSVGIGPTHDKQLSTDKHDEIVMWLYGKIKSGEIDFLDIKNDLKFQADYKNERLVEEKEIKTKVQIEFPLEIETKYGYGMHARNGKKIVGYVDVFTQIIKPFISEFQWDNSEKWEQRTSKTVASILIEVKTDINVGETVRQINYYKSSIDYNPESKHVFFYVCAPDTQYKQILEEHGIRYIEYKNN